VANSRNIHADKIGADCPQCGFSQLEPASARSTFCRQCGQHYAIEKLLAKEVASLKEPSVFDKVSKWFSQNKTRVVTCFSCREKQEVPASAQSSLCPQCGSYIDIRDFRIAGPFARSIQTQGTVHLSPDADVASNRILCGSARIEGRFRGKILCTGEATVRIAGQYEGEVDADALVVHPKGNVEFLLPVYGQSVEINGKMRGTVCAGKVVINKKGVLEGTVYARAITVEKGGVFSGSLIIGQELPDELKRPDERTWFAGGGSAENAPLPAGDFGDLPPTPMEPGMDEEVLHQPQLDLMPRRPRRRQKSRE
jgi:cytoskeletal protein CcmA (bactofilin family)/predicted RNA-binding Zn-ribbon protein involved in translation (DUF1610 family)